MLVPLLRRFAGRALLTLRKRFRMSFSPDVSETLLFDGALL
jgi:hypothetical protein